MLVTSGNEIYFLDSLNYSDRYEFSQTAKKAVNGNHAYAIMNNFRLVLFAHNKKLYKHIFDVNSLKKISTVEIQNAALGFSDANLNPIYYYKNNFDYEEPLY